MGGRSYSELNKSTFKSTFFRLLEEDVTGLSTEQKIRYMKKWLREFEFKNHTSEVINITSGEKSIQSISKNPVIFNIDSTEKIGIIVRTTLLKMVSAHLLTPEHLRLLQDEKYCKYTFDINYPFLKKWILVKDYQVKEKLMAMIVIGQRLLRLIKKSM